MKHLKLWTLAVIVLSFCVSRASVAAEDEKDEKIALDKVPAEVIAAAEKAVPGFKATEAEKESKNGAVVYELDGTANGKKYEVKIDASGKVLKAGEDKEDDKNEKEGKEEKGEKKEHKKKGKHESDK